ncbi:hypothetical protein lerEdw1_013476 [Lerista edwardsae]|nr:hypothetical protein lerEdw1_013482 [Lerista edwardsae]KAJ6650247.1 hypothetical protein lerEdw1_013476 [Lerista edwardsae]
MDSEKAKQLPEPVKKFYRGEPLALGITQMLIGIVGVMFSVVLHMTYADVFYFPYFALMTPYWTGLPFIVSGFLSVAAARRPHPSVVKSILGMNVVSAVSAGIAVVFLSLSLARGPWDLRHQCSYSGSVDLECYLDRLVPFKIAQGTMAVFLVFAVLEFCISLSSAAFGCMTLCRDTFTETLDVYRLIRSIADFIPKLFFLQVPVVYQSASPDADARFTVVHQNIPPDNAVTLPAASEDAKNLLSCSPSSPPAPPPLAPSSEAQGLEEDSLHKPGPVDQAGSGDGEIQT